MTEKTRKVAAMLALSTFALGGLDLNFPGTPRYKPKAEREKNKRENKKKKFKKRK